MVAPFAPGFPTMRYSSKMRLPGVIPVQMKFAEAGTRAASSSMLASDMDLMLYTPAGEVNG